MEFDQFQPLEIRQECADAHAFTLRLSGEFDMAACEQFEAVTGRLAENGLRELVIDLAGLTFIDSSGISALLDCRRQANDTGVELLVALPQNGQVRQVLALTGVERIFLPLGDRG